MTKGTNGPTEVNDKPCNGFVPSAAIDDIGVAAIVVYIMNAFNSDGGAITETDAEKSHGKK